jgi:hypothetical protein
VLLCAKQLLFAGIYQHMCVATAARVHVPRWDGRPPVLRLGDGSLRGLLHTRSDNVDAHPNTKAQRSADAGSDHDHMQVAAAS